MKRPVIAFVVVLAIAPLITSAQESRNGKGGVFHDSFLEKLVGEWLLSRTVRGTTAESKVKAAWVLNHQWLRLEMTSNDGREYLAEIYIGYDDAKKEYVIHWIDSWGGAFAETVGYGKADGAKIIFDFAYADGPFRNTFVRDEKADAWTFEMQNGDGHGGWKPFGEDRLTRAK